MLPAPSYRLWAGLTNSTHFAEIRWIWAGPNSKIVKKLFIVSKFQKKIKIIKKICKKIRSNSKVTGEEIFVKPGRLGW
jgi:hypothetical protein